MKSGTVFFYKNFEFSNGALGDKFFIVLNEPANEEPYLCCKTTSKCRFGITNEGCHADKNIYMLKADKDWFNLDTWIQFHELYEFTQHELLKAHLQDKVCRVKHCLEVQTTNAIRNCIKKSDDITQYQLSLLLG